MYIHSAFTSPHAVKFAKDYRAEQIRDAEQSRLAAQFHTPRNRQAQVRRALATTLARLRTRPLTTDPAPTTQTAQ
jgi:hypothetical protein